MASLTVEEQLEILINTIATASEFKPDWAALAQRMGINTNQNARLKFKRVVEAKKKFTLEFDQGVARVVPVDEASTQANDTTTKSPVKATTPRKRSKRESDEVDENLTPTKRGRKAKPKFSDENGEDASEQTVANDGKQDDEVKGEAED